MKKLENKIHIYELDCYKNATEEQKKRMRVRKDRYFDLEGLPSEEVRKLLEDFVWERGKKLAPSSLASEILYFNNIRNFLIEKNIKILRYEDENKIILQLKSWMMEKGYALTSKKYRSVYEIVATETPGIIKHMKKILRYSQKDGGCLEQERDVWELDKFEFPLRSNPIKNVKTINFKGISQITIRKEVKTVIFMHLKYMAIGSIMAEMVATKRFCRYLALRYPKIISLLDLTRDIMESYLIYLQTEAKERKNYRSDLYVESIAEVRQLLGGYELAVIKGEDQWQVPLSAVLRFLGNPGSYDAQTAEQSGLDYEDYLRMLLTVVPAKTLAMRSLDVIEGELRMMEGCEQIHLDHCVERMTAQVWMDGIYLERTYGYE